MPDALAFYQAFGSGAGRHLWGLRVLHGRNVSAGQPIQLQAKHHKEPLLSPASGQPIGYLAAGGTEKSKIFPVRLSDHHKIFLQIGRAHV